MATLEPIFVFGAGGHGRSVSEVIRRGGRYRIACVLDDDRERKPTVAGAPWLGGREKLGGLAALGVTAGFVAIGNNASRELVSMLVDAAGLELVPLVDPAAVVAEGVPVGPGSVLMPFSVAGAASTVGRGVIINTSATIDHDCSVDDFVHVSVGAHLTGGCHVGRSSFVGVGAVLGRPLRIGERAVVGAGAAVIHDVPDGVVVAGVPARELSSSP